MKVGMVPLSRVLCWAPCQDCPLSFFVTSPLMCYSEQDAMLLPILMEGGGSVGGKEEGEVEPICTRSVLMSL